MRLLRAHGKVDKGALVLCIRAERLGKVESIEDKPKKPIVIYKNVTPDREKPLYRAVNVFGENTEKETVKEKEDRISRLARERKIPYPILKELLEDE